MPTEAYKTPADLNEGCELHTCSTGLDALKMVREELKDMLGLGALQHLAIFVPHLFFKITP